MDIRCELWAECVESAQLECGALRLETWRSGARVDVLDRLEAGAECYRPYPGVHGVCRSVCLGAGIPSRLGGTTSVCSGCRRHFVEGRQGKRTGGIADQ